MGSQLVAGQFILMASVLHSLSIFLSVKRGGFCNRVWNCRCRRNHGDAATDELAQTRADMVIHHLSYAEVGRPLSAIASVSLRQAGLQCRIDI